MSGVTRTFVARLFRKPPKPRKRKPHYYLGVDIDRRDCFEDREHGREFARLFHQGLRELEAGR